MLGGAEPGDEAMLNTRFPCIYMYMYLRLLNGGEVLEVVVSVLRRELRQSEGLIKVGD